MSVPARSVPARSVLARSVPAPSAPAFRRAPSRRAPSRTAVPTRRAAPARAVTGPGAVARRSARRGFHPVFWALTAAILTTIVVALVSVSALVVETGFGIDRHEARIAQLLDEGERLRRDVAAMSAPGRIANWAKRSGLVMPEKVVVLQVPSDVSEASPAPSGAGA